MRKGILIVLIVAFCAVLLSGSPSSAADDVKIRVAGLPIGMFPVDLMLERGLDKKYNLNLPPATWYPTVQSFYTAALANEHDIVLAGWTTVILWRTKGKDWVNVYGGILTTDQILVPKESPIQQVGDLRGKRVGLFGQANSQTAMNFRLITKDFFNLDAVKEMNLHYGAPGLTASLLGKGELEAAVMLEPLATVLLRSGKIRSIGTINKIYKEKSGRDLLQLVIATRDSFAKEHPDVVRRFIKAYYESVAYIRQTPAAQRAFAKRLLKDTAEKMNETEIAAFVERTGTWLDRWDAQLVRDMKEEARRGIEMLGANFLTAVPDDAFSLDYVPK